jgi:hypothetical protein
MHSFRDNGTDGWGLAPACWGLFGWIFIDAAILTIERGVTDSKSKKGLHFSFTWPTYPTDRTHRFLYSTYVETGLGRRECGAGVGSRG